MHDTPVHNQWNHRSIRARLEKIFEVLYRQRWITLGVFLLVMGGAIFYSYTKELEFKSQAFVKVDASGSGSALAELFSSSSLDFFGDNDRSIESELFILRSSRTLVERVAERLEENADSLRITPGQGFLSGVSDGDWDIEPIAYALSESMHFSPTNAGINAIVITAKAPLAHEATHLANLFAEEYVLQAEESDRAAMTAMHTFLENQESQKREELRQIEDQMELLFKERGVLGANEESKFMVQQVLDLEADLGKTQTELSAKKSVLASIEEELKEVHPLLVQWVASSKDKQIEAAQQQIAELDYSRAQFMLRYADSTGKITDGTRLQELDDKLTNLHARVDQLSKEYVDEVMAAGGWDASLERGRSSGDLTTLRSQAVQTKIQISGLEARVSLAEEQLGQKRTALLSLPSKDLELTRLQRQYKYAEEMYRRIMEQLLTIRFSSAAKTGYASIIRTADVPRAPASPRRARIWVVGFLLALFASLNTAFIVDSLGNAIDQPENLDHADWGVLGVIPDMKSFLRKHYGKKKFVKVEDKSVATSLVPMLHPNSSITETYRSLRANVEYNLFKTSGQTLLVTSASPVEGKSVTAANIAIVMAQAGIRTILVDLDSRRPTIHKMFDLPSEVGFIDLYYGNTSIVELAQPSTLENLHVLTAGKISNKTTKTVSTLLFKIAQKVLTKNYEVVIFDAPPVLAAAEVKTYAANCDATLLIAQAGKTKDSDFSYAQDELLSVDANIMGSVLNKMNVRASIRTRNRHNYYKQYENVAA